MLSGDLVDLLSRLVRAKSLSGEEGPAIRVVEAELDRNELKPQRMGGNIICRIEFGQGPSLMFNSHLDTVPPTSGWTFDPWEPVVKEGRLYGLGANDAKGSVAAMVRAAAELKANPPPGGVLLLAFTCQEETGGEGLEWVLPQMARPDAAVVGEPTRLDVCTAQKGLIILELTARGTSCHAANAHRVPHRNAIYVAAEDIVRVRDCRFERLHPLLGAITCQVTLVSGGIRRNVVPDACRWTVDIRTTPAYTHDEIIACFQGMVESEVAVRSARLLPYETSRDSAIVRAALRAREGARICGSDTFSDLAFFAGIPAIKAGPGRTEVSHTADEYLEIDQLAEAAGFYEAMARHYFAGEPVSGNFDGRDEG
jgi:acetylornithine deacetylase